MEQVASRESAIRPVAAALLTGSALLAFLISDAIGPVSDTGEGMFLLAWVLGWVLLVVALVVSHPAWGSGSGIGA